MDRFRGLGGARKRGASGASTGSVLSAGTGHRPRRRPFPNGWKWIVMAGLDDPKAVSGRQNPPARSRGCSTPARNGAAEPRASPLYIGRGAELRRSCAPPCSRFPPPSPRAHARSRARRSQVQGGGTPLRGSVFYWSTKAMTSQAPFPRLQSPGRRGPHRPTGKRLPAISPR